MLASAGCRDRCCSSAGVSFDVHIGAQKKSRLYVDPAIGAGLTAPVTTVEPANGLPLPQLASHAYRLYPVVDQVADKVCETMRRYGDRPSSRDKDLIDLVVVAVEQARALVSRFIDPALGNSANSRTWVPEQLAWVAATRGPPGTSSARDLQDLSAPIGERDEHTDTISVFDFGSRSLQRSTRRVPVTPPETIRTLPLGTALVLPRSSPSLVTDLPRWTSRPEGEQLRADRAQVEAALQRR